MARPATRQIEILTLLARYGVMSRQVLSQLLETNISSGWLRAALADLVNKGLIKRGVSRINGSPSSYWMIHNDEKIVDRVVNRTGLKSSQIRIKSAHWSQYPHENICTLFQASIERQMPSVWVLRESTRNFEELPKHLISEKLRQNGYLPDLCLGIPMLNSNAAFSKETFRWIAVEIDRTNRSAKRVAARSNIYSRHTAFAGLLYFMPDTRTVENLNKIYTERGAKQSLRIEGGRETFLAAAVIPNTIFDVNAMRIYCGTHEIPLSTWMALFSIAETHKRDAAMLRLSSSALELEGQGIIGIK